MKFFVSFSVINSLYSLNKEDVEKKLCEQNNIEVDTRINLCVSVLEGGKNENEKESFRAPICVQLSILYDQLMGFFFHPQIVFAIVVSFPKKRQVECNISVKKKKKKTLDFITVINESKMITT